MSYLRDTAEPAWVSLAVTISGEPHLRNHITQSWSICCDYTQQSFNLVQSSSGEESCGAACSSAPWQGV